MFFYFSLYSIYRLAIASYNPLDRAELRYLGSLGYIELWGPISPPYDPPLHRTGFDNHPSLPWKSNFEIAIAVCKLWSVLANL